LRNTGIENPVKELFQKEVEILHHFELGPGYFKMGLAFSEVARMARPGQFVMARLPNRDMPLLRRPFSIHNVLLDGGTICGFELLYKVVGQGTRAMSELKPGEFLDVLGPLGNGFSFPEGLRHAFLVAGGVGVATLHFLGSELAGKPGVSSTVFLGGCSAADILCREAFESRGSQVCVTTEDCTLGERGLVTSEVEKALASGQKPDVIYACGPTPMLKAVSQIAAEYGVPCQISLETVMACGFGVCLGCAVEKTETRGTYFHTCTDGPVFDSQDVVVDAS
jgi:dihydroorotate dehydrogenase electron transfer subunit